MHVKAVYTILNGFWIHSSAGFWIPMPIIPDSTSKNFLDSGIQITLHGAKTSQLFRLNFFEREMAYVPRNYAPPQVYRERVFDFFFFIIFFYLNTVNSSA